MNISKRCVGGSHCVNEARRRVSFTEDFQEKKIFSISKEFHISRTQPHVEMIRDLIGPHIFFFIFAVHPFNNSTSSFGRSIQSIAILQGLNLYPISARSSTLEASAVIGAIETQNIEFNFC